MSDKQVVVYGASGYTGRLVCEFLREYQVPFIAAGRSQSRIEEALAKVPGIETADYEIVEVEHSVEALTERVVHGMETGTFYLFTHQDFWPAVKERIDRISADYQEVMPG